MHPLLRTALLALAIVNAWWLIYMLVHDQYAMAIHLAICVAMLLACVIDDVAEEGDAT